MAKLALVVLCALIALVSGGPAAGGTEPEAPELEIVRRAADRIQVEADWDPRCDRTLPGTGGPLSLYGALAVSCRELTGRLDHRHAALERVRAVIGSSCPGERFEHRLRDFNNTRSHGEVLAVLAIAAEEIEEALFLAEHGGPPAFPVLRSNAEIELALRALAREQPRWFRYGELGESVQGRAIPYLHVTDHHSSRAKRGVWIDAGIHGFEVACPEVVVGFAEHLGARITGAGAPAWLGALELFLVPVLNPDGRAFCMRPPYPVQRRNLAPVDDDGDGRVDEEAFRDLNGDGRIAALTVAGGEPTYESLDADGDGAFGEDLPGGVDLNRDYPVASRRRPAGWRPQPETESVLAFWHAHPRIVLAVSYHTSRNMIIAPYAPLSDAEQARYGRLAEHYLGHFPGVYWQPHANPDEYGVHRPLTGMNVEWFHAARGATAFIVEIGPDAGPRDRGHRLERLRLPGGRSAHTYRIAGGYYRTVENRVEREIESQRARHAAYLTELVQALDSY